MKRWLILYGLLVVLAAVPVVLLLLPEAKGAAPAAQTETPAATAALPESATTRADVQAPDTPRLIVRVDGVEHAVKETTSSGTRLSALPPGSLDSSLVSHVRTTGSTQILVLVDGSELVVGDWLRQSLPEDVLYRLNYDRGGRP